MPSSTAATRHKNFHRKLEEILQRIDREQGLESIITAILVEVGNQVLVEVAGISSGRLYRRDGDDYVVVRSFGAKGKEVLGERISSRDPIFQRLAQDSVTYFFSGDEGFDSDIDRRLGVGASAAFTLGPQREYVAAFGIEDDADADEVMLTLNALRYAIVHRLKEVDLEDQLREARDIQVSLLPKRMPEFAGYEIAGRSIPAEQVGGDIFDLIPLGEDLLGIAVGDASGHGLPAALQARDVITGLRMGVEKDLKITAVMRRLNAVIHRSGLTSRFISLLFGELESNGNFVYVNAGHDPGIVLRQDGSVETLRSTGIVMGPLESAEYSRDLARLEPGDVLVLYTDGIVERIDGSGGEFGRDRLCDTVRDAVEQAETLDAATERTLDVVKDFGGGQPWTDDVTIVLVRRIS